MTSNNLTFVNFIDEDLPVEDPGRNVMKVYHDKKTGEITIEPYDEEGDVIINVDLSPVEGYQLYKFLKEKYEP